MKSKWHMGLLAGILVASAAATGAAQNVLGRLESDIRQSNGQPAAAAPAVPRVYLGAVALEEGGHGVRIASVRTGGPAQRSGIHPQDLIVARRAIAFRYCGI